MRRFIREDEDDASASQIPPLKVLGPEFNLKNAHKKAESCTVILPRHGLLVDAVSNQTGFKKG